MYKRECGNNVLHVLYDNVSVMRRRRRHGMMGEWGGIAIQISIRRCQLSAEIETQRGSESKSKSISAKRATQGICINCDAFEYAKRFAQPPVCVCVGVGV